MFEILLALASLIIGAAISQAQMEDQSSRAAHDTQVRGWFDAVKSKYGIRQDQLTQYGQKLDIDLTRLADAARGSARLSRASEKYRQYTKEYPDKIRAINAAKNAIQNAVNNLSSKEEEYSSKIQQGRQVSKLDVAKDIKDDVQQANSAINEVNTKLSGNNTDDAPTNSIDVDVQSVPEKPRTEWQRFGDLLGHRS